VAARGRAPRATAAERAEAEWRAGARQLGVERSGRVGAWWARGGGGGKGQGSRRRASAASSPAEVDDRRWWRAGQRASAVEALASWPEGRAAAPTPRSVLGFIRHRWRFTVATLRSGLVSSTALQQFFSPSTLFPASRFVSRIALRIV
jgi:hypothetical protein